MSTTTHRLLAGAALAALLLTGAACGSDDGDDAAAPTTAAADAATTAEDGADGAVAPADGGLSAADLATCLAEAGLEAEVPDSVPFGVEDPVDQLDVQLADEDLTASLYVFETEEAAEENRTAITLQTEDDDRNRVAGNVLLHYSIIPSFDREGADAVEACLP